MSDIRYPFSHRISMTTVQLREANRHLLTIAPYGTQWVVGECITEMNLTFNIEFKFSNKTAYEMFVVMAMSNDWS